MSELLRALSAPWAAAHQALGVGALLAIVVFGLSLSSGLRSGLRSFWRASFWGALCLVQFVLAAGAVQRHYPGALLSGGDAGAGLATAVARLLGDIPPEVWVALLLGFVRAFQSLLRERVKLDGVIRDTTRE